MHVIAGMLKFKCHQVGFNVWDVLTDQLLTLSIILQVQGKNFMHQGNLNNQNRSNKLQLICKDKLWENNLKKIHNQLLNISKD